MGRVALSQLRIFPLTIKSKYKKTSVEGELSMQSPVTPLTVNLCSLNIVRLIFIKTRIHRNRKTLPTRL